MAELLFDILAVDRYRRIQRTKQIPMQKSDPFRQPRRDSPPVDTI